MNRLILLLTSGLLLACGADGALAPASPDSSPSVRPAALQRDALSAGERAHLMTAGGLTAAEAAELCPIGSQTDFDTYATPGVPATASPVKVLLHIRNAWAPGGYQMTPPVLHLSTDGWTTFRDVTGTVRAPARDLDGYPDLVVVFDIGALSHEAQWAVNLGGGAWLNNGGHNYRLAALPRAPLGFLGEVWIDVSGLKVAADGATAPLGQALTVHAQSFPPAPNHLLTLLYTTDGFATVRQAPMALEDLHAGPYGNNVQRTATVDLSGLAAGTQLAYWIKGSDGDNTVYASNGGANYHLRLVPAAGLGWIGAGSYRFDKCFMGPGGTCQLGWFWFPGLMDPLDLTPDAFQVYAAAPAPGVEIYAPGLTDSYPDGSAAGLLQVQVMSPFFAGSPTGTWTAHALRFREPSGNNYRYAWDVREFEINGMPAIGIDDPPSGTYTYKFRVSADGGNTWTWLGTDPWPGAGQNRTFTWATLPH